MKNVCYYFFNTHKNKTSSHPKNKIKMYKWKIDQLDKKKLYLSLTLPEDSHPIQHVTSFVRWCMYNLVPCIKLHLMKLLCNTSVYQNEKLWDILKTIPIISKDHDHLMDFDNCECSLKAKQQTETFYHYDPEGHLGFEERLKKSNLLTQNEPGCSKCSVKYELSVVNNSDSIRIVTTNDLIAKPFFNEPNVVLSSAVPIPPTNAKCLPFELFRLGPKQQFHASFYGKKGIVNNIRFRNDYRILNRCAIFYKFNVDFQDIEAISSLSSKCKEELVKSCPQRIFSYDRNTDSLSIDDVNNTCITCNNCAVYLNPYKMSNALAITPSYHEIKFRISVDRRLSPEELFSIALDKAVEILEDLCLYIEHFY
jgi:hypothetical protein